MTGLIFLLLLLLVGASAWERRSRRDFGGFTCRFRLVSYGSTARFFRRWPRRWSRRVRARWEEDVLMIRRGPIRDRPLAVRARVLSVRPLVLVLPEGALVEMKAPGVELIELVGPYLTAAVSVQPDTPARRRDT
jgi:hypothetical protein